MIVESLEYEIKKRGETAAGAIDKLVESLEKMKKVANGDSLKVVNASLTRLSKHLEKISDETVNKVERLANALEKLSRATSGMGGTLDIKVRDASAQTIKPDVAKKPVKVDAVTPPVSLDMKKIIANGSEIDVLNQKLSVLREKLAEAFGEGNVGKAISIRQQIDQTRKAIDRLNNATSDMSKSAQGATGKFSGLIKSLGRVAFYRLIRTAISEVSKALFEGLENAYAFSASINGGLARSMDQLASATKKMKNQLGAAFGELLQTIMPIILKIINAITWVAEQFSKLFAFLGGRSTYLKAGDVTEKWADSTEKGAKAAKEWKNQLLGFDEINKLEYDPGTDTGSGTINSDYGDSVYEGERIRLDDLWKKFAIFKDQVDDWFNNLFNKFKQLATEVVPEAVHALDGIFERLGGLFPVPNLVPMQEGANTFTEILEWVKQKSIEVYDFISSLAPKINFTEMIADASASMKKVLETVKKYGTEIVTAAENVLQGLGKKISSAIESLVVEVSSSVSKVGEVVYGIGEKVKTALEEIKSRVLNLFSTINSKVLEAQYSMQTAINTLRQNVSTGVGNIISDAQQKFSQFSTTVNAAIQSVNQSLQSFGTSVATNVGAAFDRLKNETLPKAKSWANELGQVFANLGKTVVTGIQSAISSAWQSLQSTIQNVTQSINSFVQSMRSTVSSAFSSVGSTFSSIGSSVVSTVKNAYSSVSSAVSKATSAVGSFFTNPNQSLENNTDYDFTSGSRATNFLNSVATSVTGSLGSMFSAASSSGNVIDFASKAMRLIPAAASGGMIEDGLFFANSGELVGEFTNGRTAVANNEMIVAGIREGVYEAVSAAMAGNSNNGSQEINLIVDGRKMADVVTQYQRRDYRTMGV